MISITGDKEKTIRSIVNAINSLYPEVTKKNLIVAGIKATYARDGSILKFIVPGWCAVIDGYNVVIAGDHNIFNNDIDIIKKNKLKPELLSKIFSVSRNPIS